jgi:hypothetical protein
MRYLPVAAAIVRHPSVWPVAARQWRRTVPGGWWRRRPFLPLPSPEYVRFRLLTQYGEERTAPSAADVLHYLRWCQQQ